ncbi:serine/threonine-protein phosphatase [Xylophilus rhododendri]|uniref:Serine/threonine-protein phosphatase n=1 Tax=Xylophilus rhododendri TaxID=2697032 RepID=A0A857J9R1_9BURK|nr:protein phosphatase 2C domain-containing protein [Xylophilus rhododendri]QHJ00761.1 serine/threonine-protein phosphatase [Xylophilus rhododendri]
MSSQFRLAGATGIHQGDRAYQQDRVALLSHPRFNGCLLGIVADGMGGRSGGRKASDQVILTAQQLFEQFVPYQEEAPALLRRIAEDAHLVIGLIAMSAEQEPHSTLAAFLINPRGDCHWVHVGDSRIYHYRGRELLTRTSDHSYVQGLVDRGEITEAEANVHPKSNILMGCLGTPEPPPITLHSIARLQPGDTILACSDGLWHYFAPHEIGSAINDLPPRDAAQALVSGARRRARGGGDNLSIALVRMEAPQEEAAPVRATVPPLVPPLAPRRPN